MKKKIISILMILVYTEINAQTTPVTKHEMDSLHDYCYICTNHEHLIIKPPYTKKFRKEAPYIITAGLVFGGGFLAQAINKTKPYSAEQLRNNYPDINKVNS